MPKTNTDENPTRLTPTDLKVWRQGLRMTQPEAAAALGGYSLRAYQNWEGGKAEIPPAVNVLCAILTDIATEKLVRIDDLAMAGQVIDLRGLRTPLPLDALRALHQMRGT